MTRIVTPLVLLLLLLTHTTLASAAPSEEDIKQVVKLAAAGAVAYDKGDYKQALALYNKAHALWANPKLSFAIAKSHEALKQYKEALQVAKRGLTENPKAVLKARLQSKVTFLQEQLTKGTLTLLITPSGADISINGKSIGTAPIGTTALPAGNHKLEISSPNYAKVVQGITIQGGAELRLSFTLQPLTGKLSVTSTPSGAEVEIDGKAWGKTPLTDLNIPTGSHIVQIKYAGYKATRKRVNISSQQSENISVVLSEVSATTSPTPAKGPWFKSWPGWTTLLLGVGAGAVGTALLVRASQAHQQVRNAINQPNSTQFSQQDLTNQWNNANTEEKVGYGLIGGAGGLVLISVILFATQTGTGAGATTNTPKVSQSSNAPPPLHQRNKATLLFATE